MIGRRPIKKIPMWRLRQANTHSDSFESHIDSDYPEDLTFIRGQPRIYMKGRLPQSLTINQTKLKPLPENPRIINSMGIFLYERFIVYL